MSTDGSVSTSSSGIGQFGLYKTIDARTEEFLRLSRKRQIRQGCACAAISTAITVAVVISIILIYEYSIINESSSKTSLKQNWLSLMNKSADAVPFEANINKAKINLDPMYLEFLPLILKTLKKNTYFNKIIEDDSTQSPLFDKEETSRDLYTTNTLSDSRNWMPTSRLYTIEYKTSPVIYFKYSTRNVDHFTKKRRIRDHQRIMNYVDKMISDRVAFTSTVPMVKTSYSFHKRPAPVIYTSTTPMAKAIEYVTGKQTENKTLKTLKENSESIQKKSDCTCPKELNRLLFKLIKSLQKKIPDFSISEKMNACYEKRLKINKLVTQNFEHADSTDKYEKTTNIQSNDIYNIIATDINSYDIKTTKPLQFSDVLEKTQKSSKIPKINFLSSSINSDQTMEPNTMSKTFYSVKPLYPKVDYSLSTMIKLIKPYYNNIQDLNKKTHTTTTMQFIEGTDANNYIPERTTKPMSKTSYRTTKASSNTLTVRDFILQKMKLKNTTKSLVTLPMLFDKKYKHVYTTPDITEKNRGLDFNSIELTKNKKLDIENGGKKSKGVTELVTFKIRPSNGSIYKNDKEYNNNTWNILKNMGKFALSSTIIQNNSHKSNWKSFDNTSAIIATEKENAELKTEKMSSQTLLQSYLNKIQAEQLIRSEDVTLEEEIDQISSEENIPEDNLKTFENLLDKINVSEIFNRTLAEKNEIEKSKLEQYGLAQIDKHKDTSCRNSKSMIPENRPTYLEIQRNDWRRYDDHQDYDNTINFQ